MPNPRELTRADVIRAASGFRWRRKMPKWTVLVEERELPARPLVLEAAGVPPNDPTNSHQAVAILESLGFETRYAGGGERENSRSDSAASPILPTNLGALIKKIERISSDVPEEAWKKIPADLSKNVDAYLYGTKSNKR